MNMISMERKEEKKKTLEERVFQLECQISMLHELVVDMAKALKNAGIEFVREEEEE